MPLTHAQKCIPLCRPGQRIGLFGGSFDPPHLGHAHIARAAITRLQLDAVWWLASPQNPLKSRNPAPIAERLAKIEQLFASDPRQIASGLEDSFGTTASIDTIRVLRRHCHGVRFVWIMGADNFAGLHRWQEWQTLMQTLPIAVFARPGHRLAARCSPAARRFRRAQRQEHEAALIARARAPAWCVINLPMRDDSSTSLRQSMEGQRDRDNR